jgi:uncharacterized protein
MMRRLEAPRSPAALVLTGAVRTYQYTLRPFIGAHCRHWPSCSEYAIEALATHGALRGTALTAGRILRCNPWNAGGVDLVPPAGAGRVHMRSRNMLLPFVGSGIQRLRRFRLNASRSKP